MAMIEGRHNPYDYRDRDPQGWVNRQAYLAQLSVAKFWKDPTMASYIIESVLSEFLDGKNFSTGIHDDAPIQSDEQAWVMGAAQFFLFPELS